MPFRFTFGVELEFALATLQEGRTDPEPTLPQPITLLSSKLKESSKDLFNHEARTKVYDLIAAKMIAAGLPTRAMAKGKANSIDPKSEFGHQWMITTDPTVDANMPKDYWWFAIEVQSPPYILCEESLEAVRLACKTLTSNFRVETNATTGLHVHFGEGADGYAFQMVKKLVAFLWAFEPQLEQLHPNRRAKYQNETEMTWYESLRRGSQLSGGQFTNDSVQLTVLQGLKYIYAADSITALHEMTRAGGMKSAYHLGAISYDIYGETIKKTIEFRQHEGTVSGERVGEWIKTIAALMDWINDVEALELLGFLENAADFEDQNWPVSEKAPYDIIDLLNDIGLVEQAKYWDLAIPKAIRIAPTPYYKLPRHLPQQAREHECIDLISSSSDDQG